MRESKYGYAVARTRAVENSLLDKNKLERLASTSSLAEALGQLADTVYGEAIAALPAPSDWERALDAQLAREYEFITEMGHGKEIETLRWRYDLVNLKLLLKAEKHGAEPQKLSALGSVPPRELLEPEVLPPAWREAVQRARQEEDPQRIDFILDRALFQMALASSDNPYLAGLWRLESDLVNITTFLRLSVLESRGENLWQEAFIPGGELDRLEEIQPPDLEALQSALAQTKFGALRQGLESCRLTGSVGQWERLADDLRVEYLNRAKYIPFGPEPLVAYVLGRENEVKSLRIILAGKVNGLSDQEIGERLREVYV